MLWFDEVGIYNILYFSKIKEKHDVRYYHDENIFAVLIVTHIVFLLDLSELQDVVDTYLIKPEHPKSR